jgi:hypothetical protein
MMPVTPESALYPMVLRWIDTQLIASELIMGRTQSTVVFSADVSQQSAIEGGLWSRPDLAAVVYTPARFLPSWQPELYSFEVKTQNGINQAAVYEAFSHTRFVNYSILVWEDCPDLSNNSEMVIELCRQYGIGALTASDPRIPHSYTVHTKPQHFGISPTAFDNFVNERFPASKRDEIERWLAENGWGRSREDLQ